MQKVQNRRKVEKDHGGWAPPDVFGDMITADRAVIAERNADHQSRYSDKYTVVIQDVGTSWLDSIPVKSRNTPDLTSAFQNFLRDFCPKKVYSDCAPEYKKSLDAMGITASSSTPHVPQTNGIAERAVRRVK